MVHSRTLSDNPLSSISLSWIVPRAIQNLHSVHHSRARQPKPTPTKQTAPKFARLSSNGKSSILAILSSCGESYLPNTSLVHGLQRVPRHVKYRQPHHERQLANDRSDEFHLQRLLFKQVRRMAEPRWIPWRERVRLIAVLLLLGQRHQPITLLLADFQCRQRGRQAALSLKVQ